MPNNEHNNLFDSSWIPAIIMLFVFWPVGLIMLVKKLSQFDKPQKRKARKKKDSVSWPLIVLGIIALSSIGTSALRSLIPLFGMFAILGGVSLYAARVFMRKRDKKYRVYQSVIGERSSMHIRDIARAVNVPEEQALADLDKMIGLDYFWEDSYVDHRINCFMAHADSRPAKSEYEESVKKETRKKEVSREAPEAAPASFNPNIDRQFRQYLSEIRNVNDAIQDERVSDQIDRIEVITSNIFDLIKEQPDKINQINTFMNYYLPTTLKLLKSYGQMERQAAPGSNITSSMQNIEKMMDQLVFAFEQQSDNLFEADALDISSDIKVLERMMAKDGLSENQYTFSKKTAAGTGGAAAMEKNP